MRPIVPEQQEEEEASSDMKTPLDLEEFQHLLPLLSSPTSQFAFNHDDDSLGLLHHSSSSSTPLPSSSSPSSSSSSFNWSSSPLDQPLTITSLTDPLLTIHDITPDINLARQLLICPTPDPPSSGITSDATKLHHQALVNYLSVPNHVPTRQLNHLDPLSSSPLFQVTPLPTSNGVSLVKNDSLGPFRPSSQWKGHQHSGARSYSVSVRILHLDLHSGSGSGLLEITGLTRKLPKLVTFFDIEIVGPHHSFATNAWGATPESDYTHWSRFPHYSRARSQELTQSISIEFPYQPFLFMRWKERFLDGNDFRREIEGASFAGFYYVCLNLSAPDTNPSRTRVSGTPDSIKHRHRQSHSLEDTPPNRHVLTEPLPSIQTHPSGQDWSHARITAYYYHAKSEPYQELNLIPDRHLPHTHLAGASATYQFA